MAIKMIKKHFPSGWDEERVRRVLAHYETQTEEAVAEDERAFRKTGRTVSKNPASFFKDRSYKDAQEVAEMDWQEYIHSGSQVLLGKLVVKGTRLSVEFLLSLFAAGWTEKQVLENYPTLTSQSLQAVFAFAAECTREEAFFTLDLAEAV